MRAYIISVLDSPRNPDLMNMCWASGLSPQVFKGVDLYGGTFNLKEIYDGQIAKLLLGRDMTFGEIGCAMSHLQIYREFSQMEEDWCLILEDDVVIKELLPEVVSQLALLPSGNNVVNLRHEDIGPVIFNPFSRKKGPFKRLLIPTWGTSSYFLSHRAACVFDSLYPETQKVECVADWPIRSIPRLDFFHTLEETVGTYETISLIEKERNIYKLESGILANGRIKNLINLVSRVNIIPKLFKLGLSPFTILKYLVIEFLRVFKYRSANPRT